MLTLGQPQASYAGDGIGLPFVDGLGQFLDYTSDIVFMLLLVLLAQGWAVSRQTIDHRAIMLGGAAVLFVLYIVLMLVMRYAIDPARSVYEFATVPGILILLLRSVRKAALCSTYRVGALQAIGVAFAFLLVRTIRGESDPDKNHFYKMLLCFYVFYFASLPLIAALSSIFEIWYSYKGVSPLRTRVVCRHPVASNAVAVRVGQVGWLGGDAHSAVAVSGRKVLYNLAAVVVDRRRRWIRSGRWPVEIYKIKNKIKKSLHQKSKLRVSFIPIFLVFKRCCVSCDGAV